MNILWVLLKKQIPSDIITKLRKEWTGDAMDTKINVLGIEVNNCTAKEAMESIAGYLQEEPMSLVEVVNADSVMRR